MVTAISAKYFLAWLVSGNESIIFSGQVCRWEGRGGVCSMWDGNCMLNIHNYVSTYVYMYIYVCCICIFVVFRIYSTYTAKKACECMYCVLMSSPYPFTCHCYSAFTAGNVRTLAH